MVNKFTEILYLSQLVYKFIELPLQDWQEVVGIVYFSRRWLSLGNKVE